MILKAMGSGQGISNGGAYYGTDRVEWVDETTGQLCRSPQEQTAAFQADGPFTAAGQSYTDVKQLTAQDLGNGLYRDVYGRTVLAFRERFPCFDSYDAMHENRYYRWWFLLENQRLTRMYREDDRTELYVTEDVLNLECKCTRQLKEVGWVK